MKKPGIQIFKEVFFIVAASAVIGAGINLVHPRGFVLVSKSALDDARIVRISADEAKTKHDSPAAVFVDAREKAEYEAARIPGSVNMPAGDADSFMQSGQAPYLNPRVEIVVYCDGASCGASAIVARKILDFAPQHVYILEKGFPDWLSRGYPVQRGK